MLTSLAYIFLVGAAMAAISQKLKLPRIIGMLVTGIVLGPWVLDWMDPSILGISAELRKLALVIILIKAGLSLDLKDLKRVGRPALLMSFLPACCEILGCLLLSPVLLGVTIGEAGIIGSVLAAVSPAVVVPRMVQLMEEKRGTAKGIPQMIMAGASLDDVFVIVLFTSFCSLEQGDGASFMDFAGIPISIIIGVLLGALAGWLLGSLFERRHELGKSIRQSMKVILTLGLSLLMLTVETLLTGIVPVSGLLAVMSLSCALRVRCRQSVTAELSARYGRLWLAAELTLFVLVGAAVDIRYTLEAGPKAVLLILLVLLFRSAGVLLCLIGTPLNRKERLYCVLSYLPKATVQAAIGSVPLSLGLSCGSLVLSIAVLSILITAPLGAIAMDATAPRLLEKEE